MSNKTYDFLKDCALIYIGALGVLYYGLAEIWHLPFGTEIMASCTVVSTFLGTILKLDNMRYNEEHKDTEEEGLTMLIDAMEDDEYIGENFNEEAEDEL